MPILPEKIRRYQFCLLLWWLLSEAGLSIPSKRPHQIRHSTCNTWPVLWRSNTSLRFTVLLLPPSSLWTWLCFSVFFSVSAGAPWVIISTHKSNVECQLLPSSLTHSHSSHSGYRTTTRSGRETSTSWVNHGRLSSALHVSGHSADYCGWFKACRQHAEELFESYNNPTWIRGTVWPDMKLTGQTFLSKYDNIWSG